MPVEKMLLPVACQRVEINRLVKRLLYGNISSEFSYINEYF